METRPKLKIELTSTDKIIEIAGWLTLAILWTLPLLSYSNLPDTISTHFNSAGQADGYGDKWIIFLLPVIGSILFTGTTVLNKFPHIFNYPTAITADNAERQYRNATRMIRYLKLSVVLVFSLIVFKISQTATGQAEGLGIWFLPLILGLIFIPLTFFVIKSFKAK